MQSGQQLLHYRFIEQIGEGGMGVVWKAVDTTLDREVAVKILPEAFAEDAERLTRFEREAKLPASLNHPNIAAVYGFHESAGQRFLAMELIPGEDLAARVKRGPLPVEQALEVCRHIARALDAAHESGVIHRDLKPANIKLTPDGTVKVLDFGLAKAFETGSADSSRSQSPTMTSAGTRAGMILGTAAYMSPEQARGQVVDKRADVWAFGCVLYECLTGRPAFDGDTVSDVLASILKSDPDWSALTGRVSARTVRLLRRCMEKDPAKRLRDVGDAGIEIDELLSGDPTAAVQDGEKLRPASWLRVAIVGVMGVVLGALSWNVIGKLAFDETPQEPQRLRLAIQLAADQQLSIGGNSLLTFSPDGTSLVFVGLENGRKALFRRNLHEPRAAPIPGTEEAESVFFSPDGRWIGFAGGGLLMKVAVEGGRPFRLAEARGAGGATWLGDGTIIFAPMYSDGLFRVPAEGGSPERLTTPDHASGELGHWWPDPLPGESRIVFTAFRTPVDRSRIGVLDLDTGETRWIVEGGFFGRYVSTGHLLYAKGQRLYALPFDPVTATATGAAVAVLDDLYMNQTSGFAMVTVSSRGTLAYVTDSLGDPLKQLVWLDRTGHAILATNEHHRYVSASLSPDDRQAALTIQGESQDLWIYSFERGTLSRLTSGEGTEFDPMWSRDGRELFYVLDSPPFELHRIAVGAPDSGRPIWDEPAELDTTHIAVSPDGRTIAFTLTEEQTGLNVYARPLDGSEPQSSMRAGRSDELYPSFSPDGNWLAYQSNETGRPEVYVEAFPGPGERTQVSADGGIEPLWARNGEIFYRHDDEIHVVPTRPGERFEFDAPQRLFSFPTVRSGAQNIRSFDVTADGARLLAVTIPDASQPRQIEIVTDWAKELERLAPGDSR